MLDNYLKWVHSNKHHRQKHNNQQAGLVLVAHKTAGNSVQTVALVNPQMKDGLVLAAHRTAGNSAQTAALANQ